MRLLGLVLLFTATAAQAGAWDATGRVRAGAEVDDNVYLRPVLPVSAAHGFVDFSAELDYRDDAAYFEIHPQALVLRYDDPANDTLDRTDGSLSLRAGFQTPRGELGASLTGVVDSTLTSELGLTSLSRTNVPHQAVMGSVSHYFQATERLRLDLQISGSANHYSEERRTELVDYNYASAGGSLQFQFSGRTMAFVRSTASHLDVPHYHFADKLSIDATLGIQRKLNEQHSITLEAGPAVVRSDFAHDTGYLYSLAYEGRTERDRLTGRVSRSLEPTGRGLMAIQEQVSLTWRRTAGPRSYASFDLTAKRNRYLLARGGLENSDVTYGAARAEFGWFLSPDIVVAAVASVERQVQSETLLDGTSDRRRISLMINFNDLKKSLR